MPGHTSIRGLITAWPDVNGVLREWKAAIEAALNVDFGRGFEVHRSRAGTTIQYRPPPLCKVAKNGGSAIAAMSGTTPGSGTVTLYNAAGPLTAENAVTAYNLHPTGTVTANAWVKLIWIDGRWFVFWEPC